VVAFGFGVGLGEGEAIGVGEGEATGVGEGEAAGAATAAALPRIPAHPVASTETRTSKGSVAASLTKVRELGRELPDILSGMERALAYMCARPIAQLLS